MAAPTLQQLLPAVTTDQVKAVLLSALQGLGPVQQVGTGAGILVLSGGPLGNYDAILTITTGGAPGAAAFKYSLDAGKTYSGAIGVPANGVYSAVGTGLVFSFSGTFVLGDVYNFQTVYPPFPVTDWEVGGGARTFLEAESATIADFAGTALPNVAAGGFNDYAKGAWLALLSHELYENDQFPAVIAKGLINVTLSAAASPKTFNPGDLVAANSQGAGPNVFTFRNVSGFTINPGQTLAIIFAATQPGTAYNLTNGSVVVLQTPVAGLSITNPAPGISAVVPSGGATGTLAVLGSPTGNFSVVLKVTGTGGLGVGIVQVSLDGGVNYASPFTLPASGGYALPQLDGSTQTGLVLSFSGSFTANDTYSFTAYAQWVTTPGQDQESDPNLQARNSNKWTAAGVGGGTNATFDYLARTAPGGGSEVTRTSAVPDGVTGGQINLTVAGYNGPLSTGALAAITTYVQQRTGLTCKTAVANASTQTIAIVGTVYVPAGQKAAAVAAITAAFAQLAAATQIAGKVFWSDLELALDQKQAGVRNVLLTTPAANTDTQLGANAVPAFDLTAVGYVLL